MPSTAHHAENNNLKKETESEQRILLWATLWVNSGILYFNEAIKGQNTESTLDRNKEKEKRENPTMGHN